MLQGRNIPNVPLLKAFFAHFDRTISKVCRPAAPSLVDIGNFTEVWKLRCRHIEFLDFQWEIKPNWQCLNGTFHHLCFHNKLNHCIYCWNSSRRHRSLQCVAQACCKHGKPQNASRLGVEHGIVASIISIITVSISHLAVADLQAPWIWRYGDLHADVQCGVPTT